MKFGLSKTKYCRGIQCPKMLWMDEHMPEQAAADPGGEARMATGLAVGELARDYFSDYSLVEYDADKSVMSEKTKRLMDKGAEKIAEASFIHDGMYCAVDILRGNGDGFDLVEVKSSTDVKDKKSKKVKDIYLDDMAFQYYLLTQCGVNVKKVFLMHLNNSYIRHGELELDKLFALEDCKDDVAQKATDVGKNIAEILAYVDNDIEPERDIGEYCHAPYDCAYYGYCARHLPKPSIFDVSGLWASKKGEYYRQGIVSFEDIIKSGLKLSEKQMQQVETTYYHRPDSILPDEIRAFLDTLSYPLYHLDFETFQPAIPKYDGTKPYQRMPFQYSLHIEQADGMLEHREFLAKEGADPRRAIAERLCADIPADACALAFNAPFEKTRIKELADVFPDLADHLLAIRGNIHDLMVPFRDRAYYAEAMQGSYSIKYVLPALFPEDPDLDYHSLVGVHNGDEASAAFADLTNHSPEEIAAIRKNLLAYCRLDTLAMVKVLGKLRTCVDA
ncbi:MAG: DUF2779 domain-containing protein [Synergistaceae bacterium]|nr:DUF2779 domain-containing protein [Synergistaceae bacterium]